MESQISSIDIGIVISYFLIVLFIGLWISRRTKTGEDLFLGGRTFGWGIIGLSLFASNISGSTIVGLAGAAYTTGIVNSVYEWMSGLPLIIAALIFIPLYLRSRITTIPEFLQKRYDRRSQLFFSVITIFSTIVIETAGALYAGGLVVQTFFPEFSIWETSLILAFVAGIYTAGGGLKAVVYTDAIQAVILIIGCGIISWILFGQLDYDWSKVVASAPEGHFSVVRPVDDPGLPWPGLLMGVPLLGFWYWSTNQYIFQRVLGAKDMKQARWGVVFAGFLKIIPLFIMVFPGAMAISLYPDIANGNTVSP
ncbi:MAG: sodium/solute symporter, partial [Bacteroidota bacterium]